MKFLLSLLYFTFEYATLTSAIRMDPSYKEMVELLDAIFPDHWLNVPLDHFNPFDNRTFPMRYKVIKKHFQDGGPLFIEVGGEWRIVGQYFMSGQLYELAKKHKGMLIETEHRYYGKTLPFPMYKNSSTEYFKYLQIEQALEDVVYFIEHFKSITRGTTNSKIVVHGCSYPGMLVTWLRLKFPNAVDIAYASSAPLNLGIKLDYPDYYENINDVYANVSSDCVDTIREGINQTEKLMRTKNGRVLVRNALSNWTCGDATIMSSYEILEMYRRVLNVMHDPYHYEDVGCLAMVMNTDDTEAYERLANFIILKSKDRQTCFGDEDESSTEDGELSEQKRNSLAWDYQACTQLGGFTTLNRTNYRHPFGVDLSVHDLLESCTNISDGMITEEVLHKGVNNTVHRYGGRKPKVTKVVTVQGTHDPWRHLEVFEDYNPEAPVFYADGSHCSDVSESPDDPEVLVELRKKVRDLISEWIEQIS